MIHSVVCFSCTVKWFSYMYTLYVYIVRNICAVCCMRSLSVVLTLSDPVDCSAPGSFVHGDFLGKILECVAMPSSRESSQPKNWTRVSCVAGAFFTSWVPGKPKFFGCAMWHSRIISSLPRNGTCAPAVEAWSLNYWTARRVLYNLNTHTHPYMYTCTHYFGLSWWLSGKESTC